MTAKWNPNTAANLRLGLWALIPDLPAEAAAAVGSDVPSGIASRVRHQSARCAMLNPSAGIGRSQTRQVLGVGDDFDVVAHRVTQNDVGLGSVRGKDQVFRVSFDTASAIVGVQEFSDASVRVVIVGEDSAPQRDHLDEVVADAHRWSISPDPPWSNVFLCRVPLVPRFRR